MKIPQDASMDSTRILKEKLHEKYADVFIGGIFQEINEKSPARLQLKKPLLEQ